MKTLVPVLAATLALGPAVVSAQSLGAVAQRAEKTKAAAAKKPAKTYTNKDLPDAPATATPMAQAAATPAPEASAAAPAQVKPVLTGDQKNPAYWKGRMRPLQAKLDADTAAVDKASQRVQTLTTNRALAGPDQRAAVEAERLMAAAELGKLNQAMRASAKAISDLRAEATAAGVPPDWLQP
jgi:hypothetical protein